jgi:hypothetical protein
MLTSSQNAAVCGAEACAVIVEAAFKGALLFVSFASDDTLIWTHRGAEFSLIYSNLSSLEFAIGVMNIRLMIAIVLLPSFAGAQETSGKGKPIDEAAGKAQSLEAEFVASDVFRSGSLIIPFAPKFAFEGHYFGGTPTETETGFTGVSWAFSLKEFKLIPGFGAIFGNNHFTASAAVSFRWEY